MEFTRNETAALFEGLMMAEHRKLKETFPRCRLRRENTASGITLELQNGRRRCKVTVSDKLDISCWHNERYGVDDYHSSWSNCVGLPEDVMPLAQTMQELYFPLLEQPDKTSENLFPWIWD